VGPTAERKLLGRMVLFSLLGGCFTSLVCLAVASAFWLSGLCPLASIRDVIRLLPAVFGVSSVLIFMGLVLYEGFLRL
jgi:hypothetical protein